jgi:Cu-Zn family superoxide dismutase
MQKFIFPVVIGFAALTSACHGGLVNSTQVRAEAVLAATQGNQVAGLVTFTPAGDKIRVVAEVRGLTPGLHGFHIHDKGDCSAADGSSAGGHFNPAGQAHGNPDHAEHHAGDMPQLVAGADGVARLTAYLDGVTLSEGERGIFKRGVIVHAAPDDFKTQPTGNSGARQACGVIVGR